MVNITKEKLGIDNELKEKNNEYFILIWYNIFVDGILVKD